MSIGPREVLVIFLVVLVLFGGSRLADIGKGLGEGIRNFKKGMKDLEASKPDIDSNNHEESNPARAASPRA